LSCNTRSNRRNIDSVYEYARFNQPSRNSLLPSCPCSTRRQRSIVARRLRLQRCHQCDLIRLRHRRSCLISDEPVFCHSAPTRSQRPLHTMRGVYGPDIYCQSQQLCPIGPRKSLVKITLPPVAKVNCDGFITRQRIDIYLRVLAFRDSESSFTTRVCRIASTPAFVGEDPSHGASKCRRDRELMTSI
jgi:hypothetical protein